jgi:hypothetical protein
MKSALIISCFIFVTLPVAGLASDESLLADDLKSKLVAHGFENVAVVVEDRQVLVTYENRLYRYEVRAVKEILKIVLPLAQEVTSITLIPQYRKIPLIAITLPVEEAIVLSNGHTSPATSFFTVEVALEVDPIWQKLQATPKANSSLRKLDLVAHPQFIAQFGDYSEIVRAQINLAPEMTTSLWNGMSLSAQVIIPLQNEFEEEGNYWRPGLMTVNQILRLPQNTFASITIGYFTQDRYGADLEAQKYFFNGRASVGANVGYTGYASYFKGKWKYSRFDFPTALVNSEYRFARLDLTFRAMYGKFLYQDKGWRWEILRQFREVDIGFFAINTTTGTNLGFNFSMPIFPPKHLPAGVVRVRTANYFPWEYRYWGIWESGASGYRYNTGNRLDDFMKRLHPDYVKNQLLRQN